MNTLDDEDALLDYDDFEVEEVDDALLDCEKPNDEENKFKASHVSRNTSGFRGFLLKPELLRSITDCGFEHPSEIQNECIPQAILGADVLCQAKSGMGKTAIFILSTLQQLYPVDGQVSALVLCHTRELAFQIGKEYERFSKYMPDIKIATFFGGTNIREDECTMKRSCPNIVVGTPGRILSLVLKKTLNLRHINHFILDECDRMLEGMDIRRHVQKIFRSCCNEKQVMMFSATLSKEIRPVCRMFMKEPMEIYTNDESKLSLDGLRQHYVKLGESGKTRKLIDLINSLQFNQVVIFVKSIERCYTLEQLLVGRNVQAVSIHKAMTQKERLSRYREFKDFKKRVLVATDLFGRGIDLEGVNLVFNYDMPDNSDTFLHRVARAGRFGTKGLAISFVSNESDEEIMNSVNDRFDVKMTALPVEIDSSSYIEGR